MYATASYVQLIHSIVTFPITNAYIRNKNLYIRKQSNAVIGFTLCTALSFNLAQVLADIAALELALVSPIGIPVGTVQRTVFAHTLAARLATTDSL